jgi:hypothetical protein
VIQVNINNAASEIVINGEVTDQPGPYLVSVTRSVDYSADNIFPAVSGAIVTINNNSGFTDSLTEISPGTYSSHTGWQGIPGHTYTLTVKTDNILYTASSTMPEPVNLDSIGFQNQTRRGQENIISAIPYFQDPPGIANYYQFKETINGKPLNEIFIFDDRLSDGKYISQPLRDDSAHMQPGDQLSLSMNCIDRGTWLYLRELSQITDAGSFSSVTPSNPDTNLSNGALGYFSAHTVQTGQTTVHL